MSIQQRFCLNHPNRPAIGICVMTQRPICGECSTRYEGINYSREGLELLHKQRREAAAKEGRQGGWALAGLLWLISPALLFLVYLSFTASAELLMQLLHDKPTP